MCKIQGRIVCACGSADELSEGERIVSKITPYGKGYLPSITGLVSPSYDPWSFDSLPSKESVGQEFGESNAESSCISGEEVSELESEADRDADGSDTEEPTKESSPCPHEERRSSERFLLRGHHSSKGKKTKRRVRRKHSKDSSSRIQSSEEEEKESAFAFSNLLSHDAVPAPFDPTPPESSQPLSALLSSGDPVASERAFWGHQTETLDDNWQRTAPHYSRQDDETPVKATGWYRRPEDDDDDDGEPRRSAKFFEQPHFRASLDDDDGASCRGGGHAAVKLLTRNVSALKRKIKKFEEEFEKTFGYRPSHSDKMKHKEIKKYMTDLSKAKKELKQMKDDIPEKKAFCTPKPFSISLLRCQESTAAVATPQTQTQAAELEAALGGTGGPGTRQTTKETYRQVEECLTAKRGDAGRPLKVSELSLDQLKEEKTDIQKALLFYESLHGRPCNRDDKELVRPLYDRYRLVKRSVNKMMSRQKENVIELAPILEHVVMDFTLASPQHRGSLKEEEHEEEEEEEEETPLNRDPHPEVPTPAASSAPRPEVNLGDLHALPIQELKERKKEAREEKRRLRHALREYEERFERETGRKMQKEDRGPMEKNYSEYKHAKAKLRLLEALLSKHDP